MKKEKFAYKVWRRRPCYLYLTIFLCLLVLGLLLRSPCLTDGDSFEVKRLMPLIFIGGVPRSGTTLMRALLDAHADVRCGVETFVIPRILSMFSKFRDSVGVFRNETGVSNTVLNTATGKFILEVIEHHDVSAKILCNKDPLSLLHISMLHKMFPIARYIFMIRDGRAVVHSVITRRVDISGWNLSNFTQCLEMWNQMIQTIYNQCEEVKDLCFPMYYEQLVLHPEKQLRELIAFLELDWIDALLNHEKLIGSEISVARMEKSTSQVKKPINIDALTSWVGNISESLLPKIGQIAPMLSRLGYDPTANPPNYGKPDDFVLQKSRKSRRAEQEGKP